MTAPVDSTITVIGSIITLAAATSTAAIPSGSFVQCVQDDLQVADVDGAELAIFELDLAAGGFSAPPIAGAVFNVYEQKINSALSVAPGIDANYKNDLIGRFQIDPADAQQFFNGVFPINHYGGKYWAEWVDGGSGVASVDAGWELRVIPIYSKLKA